MSFIDLGSEYQDVQESKPLPEGLHFLRVQDVAHVDKEDKNYLKLILVVEDIESIEAELGYPPAPIMHILNLPQPGDDEKDVENGRDAGSTRKFKLLGLKRFNELFETPMDGSSFAFEDLHGLTARVAVKHEDYQGRPQCRLHLPNLTE